MFPSVFRWPAANTIKKMSFFFFVWGFFVLFVELRYIWLTTCTLNMLIASKVIVTFGLFVNWFKDEKHVMLGVIAGINNVKTFS